LIQLLQELTVRQQISLQVFSLKKCRTPETYQCDKNWL